MFLPQRVAMKFNLVNIGKEFKKCLAHVNYSIKCNILLEIIITFSLLTKHQPVPWVILLVENFYILLSLEERCSLSVHLLQ